ncbi:S-adenosyl-L-methionine-dependent methyltransferase [Westerdykella ornata]|uniref:S-adenosyl-L-methionine-dependent methyltransferase n=1 Tax=Westerdykella ornata TaxID=318751 RepID=A0A6A6JSJ6_WESOR|nr:S-adenosyl-L-methionine-dependent methyltransferase [Westerdykella ornata]KAF2279581.1 S-adenosyl-L-methionine-dependent methyltransferase [Westerdykella ornata]
MSSRAKASPRKPKAAREASKQSKDLPTSTVLRLAGRAAAFLIVAGLASPVSQLSLSPVYGSIPASLHHQRAITVTAALAFIGRGGLKKILPSRVEDYIAVIAYWTPVIQFLLFQYSGQLGIEYGPLIIEALTYLPLLFLCCYTAGDLLDSLDPAQFRLPPAVAEAVLPIASYATVSSVSKIAGAILPLYVGTHVWFTRIGFQTLIGSITAILSPSRVILLAFPAILHTLYANPHYAGSDSALQRANATLYASTNFTLLARHESITGYVSVLENDADNAFRLMRCDHSLLGGEWMVTPAAYARGQRQREPIFSVFVLLEAIRLVLPPTSQPTIPDSEKSALVIGLGAGTAPNALISHNITTTIVELDPVVHHFASKYFDLSPNHHAVLADAVQYVADESLARPSSYNYIIHDVFTGGAEPVHLFTREFLSGLKRLLKDDGVVAINYAGDLSLPSTRLVLNTIHAVFPRCRLYRDSPRAEDWTPEKPDFINMVVFCVKRSPPGAAKEDVIRFREPTEEDFGGSIARRNFLAPREELEIRFEYLAEERGGKVMGRAEVGELERWHRRGAVSHWRIMREVLPAGVWEMW